MKFTIGIAIDGPKGPIFEPKGGAIYIAQKSGLPIVIATGYVNKKWILKTWDRMEIPKPFSKAILYTGDPFYIDRDMDAVTVRHILPKFTDFCFKHILPSHVK